MIKPEDFAKMTPKDQAAVLIHESEQLDSAVHEAWLAGEDCVTWIDDVKKQAENLHALIRQHYGAVYKEK